MGKAEQHVQGQPSHAGGGVERLCDRDEACTSGIKHIDDLGEVGERPGQPIDFVDDDHIDPPGMDVGKELDLPR